MVLLAVCIHWWHPGHVIAQDDNPPLVTPGIWFVKALGAWSNYSSYFGQIDGSFTFVPFMVLWWLADHVLGASLGQIATHYLLLAATWTGAYRLVRALGVSVAGATIGAWLYAVNPFTQLVFGNNLTEAIFLGLLAWLGAWLVTAALAPARRGVARLWLTVIAFAAMPAIGVTPSLVFQIALDFVVLLGFCMFFVEDRRPFLRWAAGSVGVMVAVSLWWAVPDTLSFVGATIPHPTALSDLAWTYARSSFLNNLRFLYTWLWAFPEYYPAAPGYDANFLTYAAGFLSVAAAALGLIVLRGRRLALCRYALAVALAVMFISKGTHTPLAWLNGVLASLPGAFLLYADPGGEVALALLLLAATAAFVFDAVIWLSPSPRLTPAGKALAFVGILAAIWTSGICLLSGTVLHGAVVTSSGELMPSEYVRVPAYWRAAADYLNSAATGGVLMLPPHLSPGYDVEYDFGYYGVDALATNLTSRRLLYLDAGLASGLGYLKHAESQALADRLRDLLDSGSPLAVPMMQDLGVRYVLYRGDIIHRQNEWYSQSELSALLRRKPVQFGPLAVYDLGAAENRFTLRRTWIAGDYGLANPGDMAELEALEEPLPRVDLQTIPPGFPGAPTLVEQSDNPGVGPGDVDAGLFGGPGAGIDRALSFASEGREGKGITVALAARPQQRREVKASAGRMSAPVIVTDIPLRNLRPGLPYGATLLTARILSINETGESLALTEAVQSPSRRADLADVVVPVPSHPNRTYFLFAEGSRYRAVPERMNRGLILLFQSVLMLPGQTTLRLFGRPIRRQKAVYAAAPERYRTAAKLYSFYFASVRPAGGQLTIGSFASDTTGDGTVAPAGNPLGSLDVRLTGADHPAIEMISGAATLPSVAAAIEFSYAGSAYRCPTLLQPGQGFDVDYVVGTCLHENLLPVNPGSLRMLNIQIVPSADQPGAWKAMADILGDGHIVMTAWPNSFAQAVPGRPDLITRARVAHLAQGRRGLTVADVEAPSAGMRGSSAASDRRMPVAMHWRIGRAAQTGDIISLRAGGCAIDEVARTSAISVDAAVDGKRRVYRQQLFPTPNGQALAAGFSVAQVFANRSARLSGVTISCMADLPPGGIDELRVRLVVLQRGAPSSIPLEAGAIRALAVARAGVVTYSMQRSGAPLAVRFGNLPPEVSVAAIGAPPLTGASDVSMACGTRAIHCGAAGIVAGVPTGFSGLAVLSQLYSPAWLGIELGHGIRFPKHVRADGWRNAWYISHAGELLVVNLVNLMAIAGLLLGFGIIAWQLPFKRS